MSHYHTTTFAERDHFVQLQQQGLTYQQIADQCGWKRETVRKHCRAFRHAGAMALSPQRVGRKKRGCLSTFAPLVRFTALRIKRQHPGWGPTVVLDEMCQRPTLRACRLPSVSQLAAYYQSFGGRLVRPRPHRQLPPPVAPVPPAAEQIVFQLDMQEHLTLPRLGPFNVLNIRAPRWGVTVGCYPHPAGQTRWSRKVSLVEARDDCRRTFEQWGLPDVLQTDHDRVLVGTGDYPFPSLFTLWLVGLGVHHQLIRRVTQNGSVERFHGTFDKQMLSGMDDADWPTFLAHVQQEQARLNERIPSRARACRGQPPLVAHPEARHPRRPYTRATEAALFDMGRVYHYLAGGRWIRHTSVNGQFTFADRLWNVGLKHAKQAVVLTFEAAQREFVVSTPDGQTLKTLPGDWLTEASIRDEAEG